MSASLIATTSTAEALPRQRQTYICVGDQDANGSFTSSDVVGTSTCVNLYGPRVGSTVKLAVAQLSRLRLPSKAPSADDLRNLITTIQNTDYTLPLGALQLGFQVCDALHATPTCDPVMTAALIEAATVGGTSGFIGMEAQGGSCAQGTLSGVGYGLQGDVNFFDFETKYRANGAGRVTGTAYDIFGGHRSRVSGIIGPNCGPGKKVLILNIN